MGIEDRDWYREKQIDWDRGGLKDRNRKTRRRLPQSLWWMLALAFIIVAVWYKLFR